MARGRTSRRVGLDISAPAAQEMGQRYFARSLPGFSRATKNTSNVPLLSCGLDVEILDPTRVRIAAVDATLSRTPSFPKFHTKWSLDTIYASAVSAAASVLVSRLKSAKMGAPSLPPSLPRKEETRSRARIPRHCVGHFPIF